MDNIPQILLQHRPKLNGMLTDLLISITLQFVLFSEQFLKVDDFIGEEWGNYYSSAGFLIYEYFYDRICYMTFERFAKFMKKYKIMTILCHLPIIVDGIFDGKVEKYGIVYNNIFYAFGIFIGIIHLGIVFNTIYNLIFRCVPFVLRMIRRGTMTVECIEEHAVFLRSIPYNQMLIYLQSILLKYHSINPLGKEFAAIMTVCPVGFAIHKLGNKALLVMFDNF